MQQQRVTMQDFLPSPEQLLEYVAGNVDRNEGQAPLAAAAESGAQAALFRMREYFAAYVNGLDTEGRWGNHSDWDGSIGPIERFGKMLDSLGFFGLDYVIQDRRRFAPKVVQE